MKLENKHYGTVKRYTRRHCKTREDKDALQEIVHRAQLAKLVKSLVKDYKGNRNWTYRSQRFSSGRLNEGPYRGRKGKRYTTEVVTIEKLLLDGFEG